MKIGLVLSGGMAKGAFQIGVLRALNGYVRPEELSAISSSSVGVLNSYAFATNKLDQAKKMWRGLCKSDSRSFVGKIMRSNYLQQSILSLTDSTDLISTPFYISLLNFKKRTLTYRNMAKVESDFYPDYLRASVALPIYNRPVTLDDKKFYDGAMVDNIPVYPLISKDLDLIICIYFDNCSYIFENLFFDKKVLRITYPTKQFILDSVRFERKNIDSMMKLGYELGQKYLSPVFEKYYGDNEKIYSYIKKLSEKDGVREVRVTGDMLVTNINKVVQNLAKHKIES